MFIIIPSVTVMMPKRAETASIKIRRQTPESAMAIPVNIRHHASVKSAGTYRAAPSARTGRICLKAVSISQRLRKQGRTHSQRPVKLSSESLKGPPELVHRAHFQ
jgi:hypothetical protein